MATSPDFHFQTLFERGEDQTEYRKIIIRLCHEFAARDPSLESMQEFVRAKLDAAISESERLDRYARPTYTVASPREALRRAKFFSEDYLNKEFDIFMSLVSDRYLDEYYHQFTHIRGRRELVYTWKQRPI